MLNKLVKNTTGLSAIAMFENMACCADEIAQNQPMAGSNVLPVKVVLIKFLITMGLVGIALVLLWCGLIWYKKVCNKECILGANRKTKLSTPTTIDDAVISFIKRNRL